MAVITFDTLQFVQTLEKAGVDREQASAFAHAVRDSHAAAELATKADIRELRAELKALELRMTIKLGSLLVAGIVLILAVLKL